MTRIEYEVTTPVGAVLLSTPDVDIARTFRRDRMKAVPGLTLEIYEVITTTLRRRVSARPQLKVVAA